LTYTVKVYDQVCDCELLKGSAIWFNSFISVVALQLFLLSKFMSWRTF
jgi:hypothetical protein